MAAFDYKKEYRDLYQPKAEPAFVTVPAMRFLAVRGAGDPNAPGGSYHDAVGLLYALSYTLKMSRLSGHAMPGAFPYVVPPLEGLWWMADGTPGVDYTNKAGFCWISMIRLPDFVSPDDVSWAQAEAARKKGINTLGAEILFYNEGPCVQCMHLGAYDDEPATVARIDAFAAANGLVLDLSGPRRHHEIYLSDPRRCAPEKCRTILRHPVEAR